MDKLDQALIKGTTYELVPEIAPLFDNTKAYAIGDCVIKDAVLYRFTTAHAAGAWIGTDAEEVTVGEELTDLKADLSDINTATSSDVGKALKAKTVVDGKVTEWEFGTAGGGDAPIDFIPNYYIKTNGTTVDINSPIANTKFSYAIVDCVEGDEFTINAVGGDAARTWCFIDIEGNVLLNSNASSNDKNLVITAPENSAKLVVNDLSSASSYRGIKYAESEINLLDIAGNVTTHEYTLLSLNGTVSAGTLQNQRVREFTIPSGYKHLRFTAQSRTGSEDNWVLYNADSFEECNSSTMVKSGEYSVSGIINYVELTEDCKMLLVISRDAMGMCTLYNTTTVEKITNNLAEPFDKTHVYNMDDYCLYGGVLYKCKASSGIAEDFTINNWEKVSYASERQETETFLKYSPFVIGRADTITGGNATSTDSVISQNVIYIDRDIVLSRPTNLTYKRLGIMYYANSYFNSYKGRVDTGYSGWNYIKKGSYIRIEIGVFQIPLRKDRINEIASIITFKTVYSGQLSEIEKGADGYLESKLSSLYQKGAAPKSFTLPTCILVAGQSNIDGRVPHASLPSKLDVALPNIKQNSNDTSGSFSSTSAPSNSVGIEWSLFCALNGIGSTFYKIKRSMGATAISPLGSTKCWTPFYEQLSDIGNSLLLTFDKQIKKCLEVNPNTFDIRAFVWQQGEGDYIAQKGMPRMWKASSEYYENFKCLIAYVRGVVGNKRLPVVCGTVSHRSGQYDPVVEAATLRVAEEDPYMICIDMSGAKLLDSYHFNADSAVYFGYKAFDALVDLGVISATKINPTRPWEEYTVTEEFTNCHSNGYDYDTVRYDGQSFTRKIYANTGYTISSVTVTMGEEDITETVYSSGTVTISSVTGNIVITATATANS